MTATEAAALAAAAIATTPAWYDVEIMHHRRDPIDYGFVTASRTWLIDLDDVPCLPHGLRWSCRFAAADHFDGTSSSIRTAVDGWLAARGVPRPARVVMLANPRLLGYVFNPLSVFYCFDPEQRLTHAIAEVRNTYGGLHCYLLPVGGSGLPVIDKQFYVSPFYPVDGRYSMRLPVPDERLLVSVTMHRGDDRPFAAVMTGTRRLVGSRAQLWWALTRPMTTRAVMIGIRRHGVALFLRGLRPYPRPPTGDLSESATIMTTHDRVGLS